MTDFAELQTEDRRLVLLRLLAQSAAWRANIFLLQAALTSFGHDVSLDRVRSDSDWLTEQQLTRHEDVGKVRIITLTQRGLDVAEGRSQCSGVKRPLPGE